jgi:hypothetical protein
MQHDDYDDLLELVEAALRDMAAKGHIRDSGLRRDGQIVWVRGDTEPHPLEYRIPEGSA